MLRAGFTPCAGPMGRCPRCGEGRLFAGYLSVKPRCDHCGLDFTFANSGDGPAVFVMLIAGFIVTGAALLMEVASRPHLFARFDLASLGARPSAAIAASFQGDTRRASV